MSAVANPATVAECLRMGAGFSQGDRNWIVEQFGTLDARLAAFHADATELEVSVKDREARGQKVTLECWIAGRQKIVTTSSEEDLRGRPQRRPGRPAPQAQRRQDPAGAPAQQAHPGDGPARPRAAGRTSTPTTTPTGWTPRPPDRPTIGLAPSARHAGRGDRLHPGGGDVGDPG